MTLAQVLRLRYKDREHERTTTRRMEDRPLPNLRRRLQKLELRRQEEIIRAPARRSEAAPGGANRRRAPPFEMDSEEFVAPDVTAEEVMR